jgi:hypothetical protein
MIFPVLLHEVTHANDNPQMAYFMNSRLPLASIVGGGRALAGVAKKVNLVIATLHGHDGGIVNMASSLACTSGRSVTAIGA